MDENELIELFTATNTSEPLSEGWPGLLRYGMAVQVATLREAAAWCGSGYAPDRLDEEADRLEMAMRSNAMCTPNGASTEL